MVLIEMADRVQQGYVSMVMPCSRLPIGVAAP
jgi:hypothetical protein